MNSEQGVAMSQLSVLGQLAITAGVVFGLVGTVLGIMNTVHARRESRPRVRVRPRITIIVSRSRSRANNTVEHDVGLMELSNTGKIPVKGAMIGFLPKKRLGFLTTNRQGRIVVTPDAADGGPWPRQIDPDGSCSVRFDLGSLLSGDYRKELGPAFMKSESGRIFKSRRKDLRSFFRNADQWKARQEEAEAAPEKGG